MKNLAIACAIAAASSTAFADGATYEYPKPITSSVTRAEVLAELSAAQTRGEIVGGELSFVAPAQGAPAMRYTVLAELAAARANDELVIGELTFVAEAHPRTQAAVPVSHAAAQRSAN